MDFILNFKFSTLMFTHSKHSSQKETLARVVLINIHLKKSVINRSTTCYFLILDKTLAGVFNILESISSCILTKVIKHETFKGDDVS